MNEAFADTNLFLRFLTRDVPDQADAVKALLQRAAAGELTLVTTPLVIAELVWTLTSFYKLSTPQVSQTLLAVVNTPGLRVEERNLVIQALVWFEEKNVDFVDAYHAAWLSTQTFNHVYTFDRKHFKRFETLRVTVPTGE